AVDPTVQAIVGGPSIPCPSNQWGTSLPHTSRLTSAVSNGRSVTVIVLIVSQPPVVDPTVSVMVDGASNTCPSNVYGNSDAHTSRSAEAGSGSMAGTGAVHVVATTPVDHTV